ncbi:MAG: hypothetical protein H0U52_18590 [Chloroflexi bacterium]|nr:hypothetical protein [Chloroflexota bacterium]
MVVARRQLGRALSSVVPILVAFALLAILAYGRGGPPATLAVGAPTPESPALALTAAAAQLEQKTAKGAPGYTFEIVQRSTIHARPGGPQIEIPDPIDRNKSLGFADTYEVGALIERGAVTPDGFTMEMRTGPAPGKPADWTAPYQFGVISTAGKTFRDDGAGWYLTDSPPGIGLDPATAALLPGLLRNATGVANDGFTKVGEVLLPKVTGSAKVADIPGVVAADGAPFTELVAPLDFAFDDQGRLAQVHVLARNTNLDVYDLLIDTTITFAYPDQAAPLPEPVPARPASADVVQK